MNNRQQKSAYPKSANRFFTINKHTLLQRIKLGRTIKRATLLFLVTAVNACSLGDIIADDAIAYNKSVSKFTNSQILLNVLRARDYERIVVTALSQIRGGYSLTNSASIGVSINDFIFPVTPSVSTAKQVSPTFDMAILDSQEFTNGFLQPLSPSVLDFYWQQRWPQDLLLYMFIQKVDHTIVDPTRPDLDPEPYHNNPLYIDPNDNAKGCSSKEFYDGFSHWVNCMQKLEVSLKNVTKGRAIGPVLSRDRVSDLKELINAEKEGLRLVRLSGRQYQLCKVSQEPKICLGECESPKLKDACEVQQEKLGIADQLTFEETRDSNVVNKFTLHLRSVQSMIYYLGEVIRYADPKASANPVQVRYGRNRDANVAPLFVLEKGSPPEADEEFSVEYKGATYHVPSAAFQDVDLRKRVGFSKTAIALVSQLLGLQKKSGELPTTTAVESVGP